MTSPIDPRLRLGAPRPVRRLGRSRPVAFVHARSWIKPGQPRACRSRQRATGHRGAGSLSPLVGVAVVYDVGFRSEPEGRSGFAHLFEHLMFQGSANVGKIEHMRLVQSAGGVVNGHTLPDLTAYYEALPAGELELGLWLEADRMASLALSEENLRNQVSVVEEEIKVNVLNRPYGGFPWITLPALAFSTYPNAHNGYGDFAHLEEATLEDAADFRAKYYAPSNAVLVVCGDCRPSEVVELAERHFGSIDRRPVPPHGPFPEPPLQPNDLHQVIEDRLAPQAAFAVGYRYTGPCGSSSTSTPASAVLGEACWSDGDASRLRRRLVYEDRSVTDVGLHSRRGRWGHLLDARPGVVPGRRVPSRQASTSELQSWPRLTTSLSRPAADRSNGGRTGSASAAGFRRGPLAVPSTRCSTAARPWRLSRRFTAAQSSSPSYRSGSPPYSPRPSPPRPPPCSPKAPQIGSIVGRLRA